jgi:Domain of unknown function (DUF4342)
MDKLGAIFEQFKVTANELGDKIRELIHEGNVRRIIIKDEHGRTFMEIPLTVATIGTVLAPILAAVGAIATLVAHFTIVVERAAPHAAPKDPAAAGAPGTGSNMGATENEVNMRDTVAQHSDRKGTKLEDLAGTGEHDSQGG